MEALSEQGRVLFEAIFDRRLAVEPGGVYWQLYGKTLAMPYV